jgi:hypothetical protein
LVARGSISYSAVTQPSPDPRRQRGTPSVTEALHSTVVRPKLTSTDPSGLAEPGALDGDRTQLVQVAAVDTSLAATGLGRRITHPAKGSGPHRQDF